MVWETVKYLQKLYKGLWVQNNSSNMLKTKTEKTQENWHNRQEVFILRKKKAKNFYCKRGYLGACTTRLENVLSFFSDKVNETPFAEAKYCYTFWTPFNIQYIVIVRTDTKKFILINHDKKHISVNHLHNFVIAKTGM